MTKFFLSISRGHTTRDHGVNTRVVLLFCLFGVAMLSRFDLFFFNRLSGIVLCRAGVQARAMLVVT